MKKATGSLPQAYFMITLSFTVRELTVEAIIKHTKFLSSWMPILEILILIGKFHSVFWNQNISPKAYSTNSRQREMKQIQKFSVWSANWQINYPVIVRCEIFPLMLKIKGLWLFFHFISGIFHFWLDIGQKEGLTCIVITLNKYLHSIDKGELKCIRKGKLCIFSPNINIMKIMLKIKLDCQLYTLFVKW